MAAKVTLTLSPAQADQLVKALGAVPKQTKTIEALTGKVNEAIKSAA